MVRQQPRSAIQKGIARSRRSKPSTKSSWNKSTLQQVWSKRGGRCAPWNVLIEIKQSCIDSFSSLSNICENFAAKQVAFSECACTSTSWSWWLVTSSPPKIWLAEILSSLAGFYFCCISRNFQFPDAELRDLGGSARGLRCKLSVFPDPVVSSDISCTVDQIV